VGIVVDVVNKVIELADSYIAAAPTFGAKIPADFIQGVDKIDDKLMIFPDVDHVLLINELSTITNLADEINIPSVSYA
jgi:purine-binding chemotaxis protein CheW